MHGLKSGKTLVNSAESESWAWIALEIHPDPVNKGCRLVRLPSALLPRSIRSFVSPEIALAANTGGVWDCVCIGGAGAVGQRWGIAHAWGIGCHLLLLWFPIEESLNCSQQPIACKCMELRKLDFVSFCYAQLACRKMWQQALQTLVHVS
jgi:hypothetical protein